MPKIEFQTPSDDVPATLRRWVDVWIEPTGRQGTSRKLMLLVSRVDKDGKIYGYWLAGPPGSKSWQRDPAAVTEIVTIITNGTIRLTGRIGNRDTFTLNAAGKMAYFAVSPDGRTRSEVFSPVWTLAEAEARRN